MRKLASSLWTAFVAFSVCLGILADFPKGRGVLEEELNNLLPLAAALLPYIAIAGVVYGGGRIGLWMVSEGIYVLTNGPTIRKFEALAPRLRECRTGLVNLLDNNYFLESEYYKRSINIQWMVEIRLVLRQLVRLGIPAPEFKPPGTNGQARFWVGYFVAMERFAANGELDHARRSQFSPPP